MAKWLKYIYERIKNIHYSFIIYQVTGSGYNGEGDVLCGHERVTYDSHPLISKIVEVCYFYLIFIINKKSFHQVGAVCNNAEIINCQLRGQPTDGALIAVAMKVNRFSVKTKENIFLTR